MAKIKCKKCGDTCCDCLGCNTKTYIDGICPSCIKKEKNANSADNGVSGVQESEKTS